jgi:hypothetical protein
MAQKNKHLGLDSGKSSTRYFGNTGRPVPPRPIDTGVRGDRPHTGDGRTANRAILGKIAAVFKKK